MPKERVKTHSFPGDVHKHDKEAMLEGRERGPGVKTYKKVILAKERAVSKRRLQKAARRNYDE